MKLQRIIDTIEKIAPLELACEWDNVGLLIGDKNSEINKVVVSLDFDSNALNFALKENADLIITHHPAIFSPISKIDDQLLLSTIRNNISVYSAHTNLDKAIGGVNYALADVIGMYNCCQYEFLRVGMINDAPFGDVINHIKKSLNTSGLRIVGDINRIIKKVGVVGGAGADYIEKAYELGCDLFVTGECKYNQAQLADRLGICIVAAGHFETEFPVMKKLKDLIKERIDIEIIEATPNNIYKSV